MCGCSKHNLVARKILDYYEGCAFDPNNRKSYITVNQVVFHILTEYFGLIGNGKFQIVGDRIAVYPKEYFLARDYRTGIIKHYKELFVIHYGDGSWLGESEKSVYLINTEQLEDMENFWNDNRAMYILFKKKKGWVLCGDIL